MKYKIERVSEVTKDFSTQHGARRSYQIQLEGATDWVELVQKPETPAPTAGQELDGTIETTSYGKKFKKDFSGGGSGSKYDSEGMAYGNSLNVAVLIEQHKLDPQKVLATAKYLFKNRPTSDSSAVATEAPKEEQETEDAKADDFESLPF